MSTLLHNNPEIQSRQVESEAQSGLSLLIRSRADAMVVYKDACWFACRDEQEEQYGLLEYLIEKWDTPSFSVSDARMLERIVDNLCSTEIGDREMEREGPEFGYAKGLLEALAQAARQRARLIRNYRGRRRRERLLKSEMEAGSDQSGGIPAIEMVRATSRKFNEVDANTVNT